MQCCFQEYPDHVKDALRKAEVCITSGMCSIAPNRIDRAQEIFWLLSRDERLAYGDDFIKDISELKALFNEKCGCHGKTCELR